MVENEKRSRAGGANDLQNLPVPGVSGSKAGAVQFAGSDRVFDFRSYVAHYRHVKAGLRKSGRCRFCEGGVDAVSIPYEAKIPNSGVDSSPGADEERDSSPTSSSFNPWSEEYQGDWS